MIDKTKFYEPAPKYRAMREDLALELNKDWFNLDLIFIVKMGEHDKSYVKFYDQWCREYEFNVPFDEIQSKFKDISKEDFDQLIRDTIDKTYDKQK